MTDQSSKQQGEIREKLKRSIRAMELRNSVGRGTAATRCRIVDGLMCEVEEGPWRMTVDMSETSGGQGRGPNPGVLGRGALASCLAISYRMYASLRGVPLDSVAVEVQADYDSRGLLGVGDVPSGYQAIRYVVEVESEAPESDVMTVIEEAEEHSPYLAVFGRPHPPTRQVRFTHASGSDRPDDAPAPSSVDGLTRAEEG